MIINLQSVREYFRENTPTVIIPYKYIVLPLLILILLFIGASFIRPPGNLTPPPNTVISPNPVFRFEINKNFMYRNFNTVLLTDRGEHKINIQETDGTVTVVPLSSLLAGEQITLKITLNKGFSFLNLWNKSFNYSYKVSR